MAVSRIQCEGEKSFSLTLAKRGRFASYDYHSRAVSQNILRSVCLYLVTLGEPIISPFNP